MYRLINANADAIIGELTRELDVPRYLDLRSSLATSPEVSLDPAYQRAYRAYWRMNAARLGPEFYSAYFGLLSESARSRATDVGKIVDELVRADPKGSLQFSFATKLAHMVDQRIPVYDRFVASFFYFEAPSPERPFRERLTELLSFHDYLATEYRRVCAEGLLNPALKRFRAMQPATDSVCDERVIDWLIWGCVSLLRRGAQRRGAAQYS